MTEAVKRRYWWPKQREIKQHCVRARRMYQMTKGSKDNPRTPLVSVEPGYLGKMVRIDTIGTLRETNRENNHILITVGHYEIV